MTFMTKKLTGNSIIITMENNFIYYAFINELHSIAKPLQEIYDDFMRYAQKAELIRGKNDSPITYYASEAYFIDCNDNKHYLQEFKK